MSDVTPKEVTPLLNDADLEHTWLRRLENAREHGYTQTANVLYHPTGDVAEDSKYGLDILTINRQGKHMCCLGVLGDCLVERGVAEWKPKYGSDDSIEGGEDLSETIVGYWLLPKGAEVDFEDLTMSNNDVLIHDSLAEEIGLVRRQQDALSKANDTGDTYSDIAAIIRGGEEAVERLATGLMINS